jgi:hypothetical protein
MRPSLSAYLTNLEQPMPIGRKIRLLLQNISIRIAKRQDCCGHPGEPGC